MNFRKTIGLAIYTLLLLLLNGCGALYNPPTEQEKSTLGENTGITKIIRELPEPKEKIVVGVYKFRDQTGQYKAADNGSSWSTAIPQGTTTILLKALEDSNWFIPIERENISNLLNERQIIRTTKQEYSKDKEALVLPPLLVAGVLLEGGVISYDTNIVSGGIGARYFGIGASTQYRQDRITVYLRAVNTLNGKIIKTVYTSKTILSTGIKGSFFRYIDVERILEAEVGVTQNEPVQLAVTEAIEKAVHTLIIECVKEKVWEVGNKNEKKFSDLVQKYDEEKTLNETRLVSNFYPEQRRKSQSFYALAEANRISGDYVNPVFTPGFKIGTKYYFSNYFNVDVNFAVITFKNTALFNKTYLSSDINLEYLALPFYKFSPYVYAGGGNLGFHNSHNFKTQIGGGIEYLFKNTAFRLNIQYDMGTDDNWDQFANGKRKDQAVRLGLGINYYFGNKK